MSSQFLIGCAVVLLFGAGVAAYWGISQGTPTPVAAPVAGPARVAEDVAMDEPSPALPAIAEQVQDELRSPVVVVTHDLEANSLLERDDLGVEHMRIAPPGAFADPGSLLGRRIWRDIPAGTVLNESSFDSGGPLARMIRSDERALAIAIDDVIGGGGHLSPGDHVDVLLYLGQDDRNPDRTAQVVVPALRVLSVGSDLGITLSGEDPEMHVEETATAARRTESARTAVLAVPAALLTRLSLAINVGRLNLAVRSADEELLQRYLANDSQTLIAIDQQLFQFEKMALLQAPRPQPGLVEPPPPGIEVHRGTSVSRDLP